MCDGSVRLSGAYTALVRARTQMRFITQAQAQLREQCAGLSAGALEQRKVVISRTQNDLRRTLTSAYSATRAASEGSSCSP